jgi:hypothetical protein
VILKNFQSMRIFIFLRSICITMMIWVSCKRQ